MDRERELWADVDTYLASVLGGDDPVLTDALDHAARQGLPAHSVSPSEGRFLATLVHMSKARYILEIGTLAGYSTIHLARATGPEGEVVTLEYDSHHAAVARANLERAGLGDRVEVRVGAAAETLPLIEEELRPKFDFVFIDADKTNNRLYIEWALRLARPGAVVVVDNVVRAGHVVDAHSTDPSVKGSREALEFIGDIEPVASAALQTVGSKGHDGFALFLVPETAAMR
ncbi:MAG: O-methyltransferase [Alphaproteobacteria bacterium]|nr:O-methyltransferase [Alphaproteobacteria bacterium]